MTKPFAVWPCGHRKIPSNLTRRRTCLTCAKVSMLAARAKLRPYAPSSTFICGHPKDAENSTREAHPRCRRCHRGRQNKSYKVFKCGHEVTPDNTIMRGPFRRCIQCLPRQEAAPPKLEKPPRKQRAPHYQSIPRIALPLSIPRPLPPTDHETGRSYNFAPSREKSA